ncbi:thioredoxin domain-containing protein [Propionibacteriaceae bacterium G1746]
MSTKKATGKKAAESATRREQLRAQQEAQAKKQKTARLAMIIVSSVVALAIIAVVATVVIQDQRRKSEQASREASSQITPPNAVGQEAILALPAKAAEAKYTLNIYMDYQCPICKQSEDLYAPVWTELANEGFVKLQVHTMSFMDGNLKNDSSTKVAIAAACADTTGRYWEYHGAAFKHQPETEGAGYTDQDITRTIPEQAGITGAEYDKWKSCYDSKATSQFVRLTDENAFKAGVTGTPTIMVNGKNPQVQGEGRMVDWWKVLDPTTDAWKKAIESAANS